MTGLEPSPHGASTAAASPAALLELGRSARVRGEFDVALGFFAQAGNLAPSSPWPRLERAATLRLHGRPAEAEELYAAVLTSHPGNLHALLGLGHIALARGEYQAALQSFAAGEAAAEPSNPWPRLDQAMALRAMGRDADAEAVYLAVLTVLPGTLQALLGLGQLARARGDHAGALHRFRSAAEAASANPWPRLEEAATLRLMGCNEAAEAAYATVLRDHAGSVPARLGLGQVARDRGDHRAAADHFRQATDADPKAGVAWLELATELRQAGDFDQAAAIARNLLAATPGDLQAWFSLGRTERAAGRHRTAFAAFRSAHQHQPASPFPLVEMAAECRALGNSSDAQALLRRALELDVANVQALEQLGELARLARDHEAALDHFSAARRVRTSNVWPWLGIARTLSDMGRREDALECLVEAEGDCGASPDLEASRLDIQRRSGDWNTALSAARHVSERWPQHLGLWIQRFRLETLLSSPHQVEACLASAPGGSLGAQVRLCHFRGLAAEEQWHLKRAVDCYENALALRPDDAWALSDLTRARILTLDIEAASSSLERLTRLTAAGNAMRGRIARASQTHFGQLLDEFAIDGPALKRLIAVRDLPPEQRLDPLLHMVRRRPDHTPSAMMLMIALRQAGRLDPPAEHADGTPKVPRQIAQYWDSFELPPELEQLAATWHQAHPLYQFRRFDDQGAQAWLRENCAPETLEAYRRAREPAQKADLFRLAWLFAEGGWWVDADDRCLAPLETVAPNWAGLVLYQEDYGTVGNNVIGTVPHHPVMGAALDWAVAAVNRGDSDILWFSTGPGLLTRALAATLAGVGLSLQTWLRSVRVLTRVEMHHVVAMHCQLTYKSSDRHWSRTAFGEAKLPPRAVVRVAA